MRKPHEELLAEYFTDCYATSINMDLADWYLTFAAEERDRQAQWKDMKKEYQADVLEMDDRPLLCCPEDQVQEKLQSRQNCLPFVRTSCVLEVPTMFAEEAAVTDGAYER